MRSAATAADHAATRARGDALLAALAALPEHDPRRPSALARAVEHWVPLAERLALRYRDRGEDVDELRAVALAALVPAVLRHDPARGPFVPYAVASITGELRRHFRDHAWGVRVPRRLQDLHTQVGRAVPELSQELGRAPRASELAARLGVPEDDVHDAMRVRLAYLPDSLDRPVDGGRGETTLGDVLGGDDPALDLVEMRAAAAPVLAALPPRQQRLLALRFGAGMTQTEIAGRLGVSQMQVSRLLDDALRQLRQVLAPGVPA